MPGDVLGKDRADGRPIIACARLVETEHQRCVWVCHRLRLLAVMAHGADA